MQCLPLRGFLYLIIAISIFIPTLSDAEGNIPENNIQLNLIKNINWESYKKYAEGSVEIPAPGKTDTVIKIHGDHYIRPPDGSDGRLGCETWIKAPSCNTVLKLSACIKGEKISTAGPWQKFRITIYAKDKNNKSLLHNDIVCTDGDFDWKNAEGVFTVPPFTENLIIRCELTSSEGTAWIKDMKLIAAYIPIGESELLKRQIIDGCNLAILPTPSKVIYRNGKIIFRRAILKARTDFMFEKEIAGLLKKNQIPYTKEFESDNISDPVLSIIIGNENDEELGALFKKEFPGKTWKELGDQGYFLLARKENAPVLYIGGNTRQGVFYGLQTFRQILTKDGKNGIIPEISIFDLPFITDRGIAIGTNWLNKMPDAVERMSMMRLNFIWMQGRIFNSKFTCDKENNACWRKDFNDAEKKLLKTTLELCKNNYIKVALSIGPRGNPQVNYSSDADIDTMVNKFYVLYEMGFRDFGINFDDLTPEGEGKLPGMEYFKGDAGKAHVYFCTQIYEKCMKRFKDANFYVLPMFYGFDTGGFSKLSEEGKKYLQAMAFLPPAINLVVCPSGLDNAGEVNNIELVENLVQRKVFIWDNYFCNWGNVSKAPTGIAPLIREGSIADKISGYMFLPIMPGTEDALLISWWTSADYMWNPQGYNSEKSLLTVTRKISESGQASMLIDYYEFIRRIYTFINPYEDKVDRINYIEKNKDILYKFLESEKPFVDKQQKENINNEISGFIKLSEFMEENEKNKAFPSVVKKVKTNGESKENCDYWENSGKLSKFCKLKQQKFDDSTCAFLSYDHDNIYVKVTCGTNGKEAETKKMKRDSDDIFRGESIELFIMPERSSEKYYHIVIDPAGSICDEFNFDRKWNGNFFIKTDSKENMRDIELKIPVSNFNLESIESGQKWNFNICRNIHTDKGIEHITYAPLLQGTFNSAKEFWTLEFE